MTRSDPHNGHYDYHEQYYSLNSGAHRKGGVELVCPTLTHHLGLWHAPVPAPTSTARSLDRFGAVVDKYVWVLYKALRNLDEFESNFVFRGDEQSLVCFFGGVYAAESESLDAVEASGGRFHFGLEDFRESDNKILFMKARWDGLSIIVRCEFHSEYFTATRFVTVADVSSLPDCVVDLESDLTCLAGLNTGCSYKEDDVAGAHKSLYLNFWEILDQQLFDWRWLFDEMNDAERPRIFADFRGLVMPGEDDPDKNPLALAQDAKERPPFEDAYPSKQLFPSIWPFLKVKNGLDLKRREFTASFMLDKRAVYISALGPQPAGDHQFDCAPLQYFLVVRPVSDWQLGALVDRLHFMGTVRLAALMELESLRKAGANLRDMEPELDAARQAIENDDLATATRHYQNAIKLIAHRDDAGPIFWAGLPFRVERSRYYVQRFKDFVEFLRIDAIEGYQPYDVFVKGRLGGVYDYIDRLGKRQDGAVRSAESLYQLISLKEAAVANERNAKISEQNTGISRAIEKLQTKAEIALVLIIVPHYLILTLNEICDRLKDDDRTIARWDFSFLAVGLIFAVASLWTYWTFTLKSDDAERKRYLTTKYVVILTLSFLAMFFIVHR